MTKMTDAERAEVDAAVRRDLPGWKLSSEAARQKSAVRTEADGAGVRRVGDLEQLRKKFLGGPAPASADASASSRPAVRTVLVEPVSGGAAKVADVVDGRVRIVQG